MKEKEKRSKPERKDVEYKSAAYRSMLEGVSNGVLDRQGPALEAKHVQVSIFWASQ